MTTIRRKSPKLEELEADETLAEWRRCSARIVQAISQGADAVTLAELHEAKAEAKFRYTYSFHRNRRCWSITAQRSDLVQEGVSKNIITLKDGGLLYFMEAQEHAIKMAAEFKDPLFQIHIASLHAGESIVTIKNWATTGWRRYSLAEARVIFAERWLTKEQKALETMRRHHRKMEEKQDLRCSTLETILNNASDDFCDELEAQKPKVWWVSWYFPLEHRSNPEIASQWPEGVRGWISGESDKEQVWCARVEATTRSGAWDLVHKMYGSLATHIRTRFEDEKEVGWWPEPTRFPR